MNSIKETEKFGAMWQVLKKRQCLAIIEILKLSPLPIFEIKDRLVESKLLDKKKKATYNHRQATYYVNLLKGIGLVSKEHIRNGECSLNTELYAEILAFQNAGKESAMKVKKALDN